MELRNLTIFCLHYPILPGPNQTFFSEITRPGSNTQFSTRHNTTHFGLQWSSKFSNPDCIFTALFRGTTFFAAALFRGVAQLQIKSVQLNSNSTVILKPKTLVRKPNWSLIPSFAANPAICLVVIHVRNRNDTKFLFQIMRFPFNLQIIS